MHGSLPIAKGENLNMNKKILAVVSVILAFAFLFAFAGCSSTSEEETTTTVKAKTPLPTDITTSLDEESKVVTDTTYSPENLQKNTATIFEYFNLHVNELKDIKATVKMSQKKKITKATDAEGNSVKMSDNEYVNAAINSLDSYMLHNDGAEAAYGDDLKGFLPVKGMDYVSALTLDASTRLPALTTASRGPSPSTSRAPLCPQLSRRHMTWATSTR